MEIKEAQAESITPASQRFEDDVDGGDRWSTAVEDLVDAGDVDGAISLLEALVAKLESRPDTDDLCLSCALHDLSNLYSSQGQSLQADLLRKRALACKLRSQFPRPSLRSLGASERKTEASVKREAGESAVSAPEASEAFASFDEDDWEAIVDRGSQELLCPLVEAGVSKVSLEDREFQTPKRRGRGTFMYKKNSLYSDQVDDAVTADNSGDESCNQSFKGAVDIQNSKYGTSHVLVLADFPPSTRTTDLERVFERYKDQGVVIRWVNDTVALAVFRTPVIAQDAYSSIHFPFAIRLLDEDNSLLNSISVKDLEPPYPRPKTSARTAQRLIARGMGQKVSSPFGSNELKQQEEARRNRIITRQILRDEAWGPDDPK